MIKNMNQLAVIIADKEGLRESVSIAQIKEILKLVAIEVTLDTGALVTLLKNGIKNI